MEFEARVLRKGWFAGRLGDIDVFSDDDAKAVKITEATVEQLAEKYGHASVTLKLANGAGA